MSPLRQLLYTVMCSVFLFDETNETRQNIALQKTSYQSTTLGFSGYNWTADLAVDNKTICTDYNCLFCAITRYEYPSTGPWWEIDLGEAVKVGKVKVFGISGRGHDDFIYDFKMFVSETTPYNNSNSPYVYINNVTSQYLANLGVTDVLFGDSPMRYVALALNSPGGQVTLYMSVCEVQVFMPCDNYHFEPDCAQCHCDGAPCDKLSGICPSGCTPGWMGQRCDKVCPHMSYGENCTMTCGSCYDNITCNHVTGICKSCAAGFHGDMCNSTCTSGSFGSDCKSTCGKCRNNSVCDIFTGNCSDGCAPGYQGDQCLNVCPHMSYGENCTMTCGSCYDNITCNHVTGICKSCAAGFHGDICNSTCTSGTFGSDCKSTCGECRNNSVCDIFTGNCSDGCAPGYQGDQCLNGDACDVVNGNCPRGCETIDCEAAVPKALVHLESVFIGGGAGLVLMALIVGIVLGVRHALQKHRSATEKPTVASDCQDQPACEEQRHAPDHRNNAMYVELEHVSHDEHQYDTVIG